MLLMLPCITSTGEEQLNQVALMDEQGRDEGRKPKRIHVCPAQGTYIPRPGAYSQLLRTQEAGQPFRRLRHSDAVCTGMSE